MRKRFVAGILGPMLSLAVLGTGMATVVSAKSKNEAKHITGLPTPHTVPPQLQGKPAPPNPDPGIASSYSTKTRDIGIVSEIQPPKNFDEGMTPQYPPSLRPPNGHPATPPGQIPKAKSGHQNGHSYRSTEERRAQ